MAAPAVGQDTLSLLKGYVPSDILQPRYSLLVVAAAFVLGGIAPKCVSAICTKFSRASCRDATKPVVQRGTQEPEYETSDDEDDSDFPPQKEHKMVLVVRTDLGMTKGKMAAQCCHAAVAAVRTAQATAPSILKHWELYGAAKVALKCSSEEEMLQLHKTALDAGVIAEYIEDAGRTQIPEGSRTVLAIGPAPIAQINQITGHLKLL